MPNFDWTTVNCFGGCPICGGNDGYLNIRRSHFFYCGEHLTYWWVGINIFPTWENETPKFWEGNAEILEFCEKVVPIYPDAEAARELCARARTDGWPV